MMWDVGHQTWANKLAQTYEVGLGLLFSMPSPTLLITLESQCQKLARLSLAQL